MSRYPIVMRGNAGAGRALAQAASILVLALGCVGCAAIGGRFGYAAKPAAPARARARLDPVIALLRYAHTLAADRPSQRAAAVIAERARVAHAGTGKHYARLAIALGTPGQPRYAPAAAARYAQRAVDDTTAHWSTAAAQYLSDYARLYRKIAARADRGPRVRAGNATDAADAADAANAANARRIARLQAQLSAAHRKLRALANVENRLDTGAP